MDYLVTPEWQLTLEQPYQRRVEDNQLVLWTTGRTVLAVPFRFTRADHKETLLAELRARAALNKVDTFESSAGGLTRFATLEPEEILDGHLRLALHAFSASESACLQTAFYFDIPSDLTWAIAAWESIRFNPQPDTETHP